MRFTKIELASVAAVLVLSVLFLIKPQIFNRDMSAVISARKNLENTVLPISGIEIPAKWGDLGSQLINAGVIDQDKFEAIYSERGGLTGEEKQILYGKDNGNIKIAPGNAGFWLNVFWALGLGNKNKILEEGPMITYGGASSPAEALAKAGNFASTGGWTISKSNALEHYSKHQFIVLTLERQKLVEEVSKNIYRPCCGNSTYFPDCNHGMAMLGLLEFMASQNISEKEMYRIALQINSYWFPDTYLTIAEFLKSKGVAWEKADPKEILGYDFSSAAGYQNILSQVAPSIDNRGQSCGI